MKKSVGGGQRGSAGVDCAALVLAPGALPPVHWTLQALQALQGDAPCMHSPHHARIRYDSPPSTSTHPPTLPRSRRLCVDLPYGLVCFKGMAEILKVPTPTMDK